MRLYHAVFIARSAGWGVAHPKPATSEPMPLRGAQWMKLEPMNLTAKVGRGGYTAERGMCMCIDAPDNHQKSYKYLRG